MRPANAYCCACKRLARGVYTAPTSVSDTRSDVADFINDASINDLRCVAIAVEVQVINAIRRCARESISTGVDYLSDWSRWRQTAAPESLYITHENIYVYVDVMKCSWITQDNNEGRSLFCGRMSVKKRRLSVFERFDKGRGAVSQCVLHRYLSRSKIPVMAHTLAASAALSTLSRGALTLLS